MSHVNPTALVAKKKQTPPRIQNRKGGEPIVCLTAYTTPMAQLLDPYMDVLLVGDSLGMVLYGEETTLGVTLEMMIRHGRAVVRGAHHSCVVVDLPFASYQESPEQAFRNAARLMAESGCAAVKIEGGAVMAETISFLTQRGIPVMAHVGLLPQSVRTLGGFRIQGKTQAEEARILQDAKSVSEAGAFAVVVEGVMEPLAAAITKEIAIPTIGIGASPACDGQILVSEDMLGLAGEWVPSFVKKYAQLGAEISKAAQAYSKDVKTRQFPGSKEIYRKTAS